MTSLTEQLLAIPSAAGRAALLDMAIHPGLPEVRKATWTYGHVLRRRGDPDGRCAAALAAFTSSYVQALRDHIRLAIEPELRAAISLGAETPPRTLIAGWHFPEHVALIDEAARRGILVLAAARTPWLDGLAAAGLVLYFRERGAVVRLTRWLRAGRPVYAMVDHCYPETAAVSVPFLTYPARTPIGIFRLAARHGYQVDVLAPRAGGKRVAIVQRFAAEGDGLTACRRTTQIVAREILRRPPRWTMWPALDSRWQDVDYDG